MPKSRADGRRTKEKVLEVAIPLFARHGYAGTSIRMISKAAKVNVATLAYHFGDKDGLYDTVVTRLHEDLQEAFPDDLLQGPSDELLAHLVRQIWTFVREHREHNRLLLRHVLDQGSLPAAITEQWSDQLFDKAIGFLRLFRPDWSETRCRLLVSMLQHTMVRWALESESDLAQALGNPEDPEAEILAFFEDLLKTQLGLSQPGAASVAR